MYRERSFETETDVRNEAKRLLEKDGFIVLLISDDKRNTNTPGTPDMFVAHPKFGNKWVAIEAKKPGGKLREAQIKLFAKGVTMAMAYPRIIYLYVKEQFGV